MVLSVLRRSSAKPQPKIDRTTTAEDWEWSLVAEQTAAPNVEDDFLLEDGKAGKRQSTATTAFTESFEAQNDESWVDEFLMSPVRTLEDLELDRAVKAEAELQRPSDAQNKEPEPELDVAPLDAHRHCTCFQALAAAIPTKLLMPQEKRAEAAGIGGICPPAVPAFPPAFLSLGEEHGFRCLKCNASIFEEAEIVSSNYHAMTGPGYLTSAAQNVTLASDSQVVAYTTGRYTICEVSCKHCNAVLGAHYLGAADVRNQYKVGKYLLGRDRLVLPPGVSHPKDPM